MKFTIREGFVAKLVNKVDLGEGKFDYQEVNLYPGPTVDLTAEQAEAHAHKLEPRDKAAETFLAAKVLQQPAGTALGLTPEAMALVQATATALAQQIAAAISQAPQAAPAA